MSESVIDSTRRVVREASPDEDAAFRKRLAESRSEKPESLKPIDGPRFLIVYVDGGEVGVFHRESRIGLLLDKETVATIVAATRK
jgi:ABC-type enterochelin transport system substrate-binding protein